MSDAAVSPAVNEHEAALATPFVKCLVRLIRAQDFDGSWRGKADTELLAGFIITKEQRRAIPIIGDPDPDVLWRLDMFYTAVSLAIEERSGLITSPMKEMKPMGASGAWFPRPGGWSFCRDVHRFGFETFRKLAEAGTKLVDDATAAIGFPPWRGREETDFEEDLCQTWMRWGRKSESFSCARQLRR
ncbi:NifX-associated nitrogen fixation protein (plasmid) [Mesorhizobium sp. AR10]|uniref:NifX-associated nitrogen fixation protein n=1 Tax=Mesorhizobium sp. AR10 TaxID=2865839 RepID=UPI00215E664B|nr:NifX-associated nitrogen fixation protein [Mesorhizobium sp. AR10]UVK35560.1 NifX-associated nitrogen fixation protein [Mesorhizobium sp. AR10]